MAKIKYTDINWEDDEVAVIPAPEQQETADFAALLATETPVGRRRFRAGEQVPAVVVHVSAESNDVLVDLGGHVTGILDKASAANAEGEIPTFRMGDEVRAYVIAANESEIRLSLSLSLSQQSGENLTMAWRNKLPVRGKVEKENKGGFDVIVLGKHAFCPVSQMDLRFVEAKTEYIGKEFEFLIEKVTEGGRNIVVSRAALLRQQAELKIREIEDRVSRQEDVVFEGTVTETRDYGAFVDIGGIDGFVHVSEMSYARVGRAQDFLSRGERVRVKVLKTEIVDGKRRISLSMKAAADDPWLTIGETLQIGSSAAGKVMRLEAFGAFVSVAPGIEGLIHISEMAWGKKVRHPNEVLKEGETVNVRIVDINTATRRIALSLKDKDSDPWKDIAAKFPIGHRCKGKVESLKSFGAIIAIAADLTGLLPISTMKKAWGETYRKRCSPPQEIEITVAAIDPAARKILLGLPEVESQDTDQADFREYVREQSEKTTTATVSQKGMGTFGALLAQKLGQKKD